MSRQIDSASLTQLLQELGRCYQYTGRLYLVGGSSLILLAAKPSTLDVDIDFEVDDAHHRAFIICLRTLSRELGIPIEQAAPHQFIPLPKGSSKRHQFIGRFGQLDVFHYDPYAVALSKIHRGNEKDFADVISMMQLELIDVDQLTAQFEQILPEVDFFSLRSDSADYQRKFNLLIERWRS